MASRRFLISVSALATLAVLVTAASRPAQGPVQGPVQVAAFSSVEGHDGSHVVLRYGATPRVTVVKGNADCSRIAVANGVLRIQKWHRGCPRRSELEVEVVAPVFTRITQNNGGWIVSRGSFRPQPNVIASVNQGGMVDIRSMVVDRVTASIDQGGMIYTVPRSSLAASISNGGAITYWGTPEVRRSVDHGGVVQKGEPGDIDLPISEINSPVRRH